MDTLLREISTHRVVLVQGQSNLTWSELLAGQQLDVDWDTSQTCKLRGERQSRLVSTHYTNRNVSTPVRVANVETAASYSSCTVTALKQNEPKRPDHLEFSCKFKHPLPLLQRYFPSEGEVTIEFRLHTATDFYNMAEYANHQGLPSWIKYKYDVGRALVQWTQVQYYSRVPNPYSTPGVRLLLYATYRSLQSLVTGLFTVTFETWPYNSRPGGSKEIYARMECRLFSRQLVLDVTVNRGDNLLVSGLAIPLPQTPPAEAMALLGSEKSGDDEDETLMEDWVAI